VSAAPNIMNASGAGVEVDNVTVSFGGVTALNRLSFEIKPGEIFGIIGPNGAGKTTLFNCLSTVCHPQNGSVRVDGQELVGAPAIELARLRIARTFQNLGVLEKADAAENILLGRHPLMKAGVFSTSFRFRKALHEENEHRAKALEIAMMLDLGKYLGRPCGALPYGVRKLVELGRALASEPRLLLLDEPVAGMNLRERDVMVRHIRQINARGTTILLVEHDMSFVMRLVSRALVLDFGEAIACGTPAEVQTNARVIEAYMG
jgi:branched-chain amino acid transport system ATP-binding protein